MARLEWKGDRCYFEDDAGITYRVYDAFYRDGKHHPFRPGSSRQPQRLFILNNRKELHRVYEFSASDNRQVTVELLTAQLAKAKYFALPERTAEDAGDWRAKIKPDTPEIVAEIRERNAKKAGEPRKRR